MYTFGLEKKDLFRSNQREVVQVESQVVRVAAGGFSTSFETTSDIYLGRGFTFQDLLHHRTPEHMECETWKNAPPLFEVCIIAPISQMDQVLAR